MSFKQVTIIGTGLIGGSLGLALKRARFRGTIVGCDRPEILKAARKRGAIDRGVSDPLAAVRGADLVVLATPIAAIIDLVDRLGPALPRHVFVTDVGSTKQEIVARARAVFGRDTARRFLGGHPMAGKEHGGIAHADAALFRDALWFLTPDPDQDLDSGAAAELAALLAAMDARVSTITPERHDRLVAWSSHLPQLLSTALASALADAGEQFAADFADDLDPRDAGGRALGEMTRLASSPYAMWRDIALTNTANIEAALSRLEQKLAHIRENLRTRGLEAEFARAQGATPTIETPGRSAEKTRKPAPASRRRRPKAKQGAAARRRR